MKNLIFIAIAFVLNACVDQGSSSVEFTMYNQTDKTAMVLGFIRDSDNPENSLKADPIEIAPQSSFKVTRFSGLGSNIGMSFYSIKNGGVDSVRVIFDNARVLSLTLEGTFNQGQTIFQGDNDYNHFITEQDYQDAVDCNGNCE